MTYDSSSTKPFINQITIKKCYIDDTKNFYDEEWFFAFNFLKLFFCFFSIYFKSWIWSHVDFDFSKVILIVS